MGMLSMRDLAYELSQPAEILANTLDDFQVAVCFIGQFPSGSVCLLDDVQGSQVFWVDGLRAGCLRSNGSGRD
jgi:hypothetical protein